MRRTALSRTALFRTGFLRTNFFRIAFFLLIVVILVLALTTFGEARWGTDWSHEWVYGSWWFVGLWALVAFSAFAWMLQRRLWKRRVVFMLHVAFGIILGGALLSHLTSREGTVYLRVGEGVVSSDITLPFEARLDSFAVQCYPGTDTPQDFVSWISFDDQPCRISMNRVARVQGYRFCQASYDTDGRGSYLSVSYDSYGTALTYLGYLLLAVSMLLLLVHPSAPFRTLLRRVLGQHKAFLLPFLLLVLSGLSLPVRAAQAAPEAQTGQVVQAAQRAQTPLHTVSAQKADSLGRLPIVYNGRVMPLNTLARDFCSKLYGKPSYRGLQAEQVLAGWLFAPDEWSEQPIVYNKRSKKWQTLHELFPDGKYWSLGREMDEKVGLIMMLREGTLFKSVPQDGSVQVSERRLEAELLYNRIPFSKLLFMVCLTLGFLSFGVLLSRLLWQKECRWLDVVFSIGLYLCLAVIVFAFAIRWYVAGHVPLSNGYETMQFVALCMLLTSAVLHRRFRFMVPFGFLLAGFTLLVAWLGEMNPQITPLMPVLHSPWLSSHVSLIMMSYALFAFLLLNGLLALFLMWQGRGSSAQVGLLTDLSKLLLYPALACLAVGIFLGAVWANVSWGRYWGWDPKEVWALITMLVYSLALHGQSLKWFRSPKHFHLFMVFAFLTVLMTYFGVNYILGGMHSYAG